MRPSLISLHSQHISVTKNIDLSASSLSSDNNNITRNKWSFSNLINTFIKTLDNNHENDNNHVLIPCRFK